MEKDQTTRIMRTILFICLIIMLIGSIFKIQHYPYGNYLLFTGIGSYLILSLIEIERLRKQVEKLTKENEVRQK